MISCRPWISPSSVHPHARGENPCDRTGRPAVRGSPPRAWGKCLPDHRRRKSARFTPTRVGKISCEGTGAGSQPVHPHARGENEGETHGLAVRVGSPPRAWGKFPHRQPGDPWSRFTPTRVGKICASRRPLRGMSVHPHARGENVRRTSRSSSPSGSPPRAWGKLAQSERFADAVRFTPTRVGKIRRPMRLSQWYSVHPHARGENYSAYADW